jgi:hypothetical protein
MRYHNLDRSAFGPVDSFSGPEYAVLVNGFDGHRCPRHYVYPSRVAYAFFRAIARTRLDTSATGVQAVDSFEPESAFED